MTVVSNASPLIALHQVGQLEVCAALFGRVCIPPAVYRETFQTRPQPPWIAVHPLTQPLAAQVLRGRLGAGEREAIALSLELKADLVLLDDAAARRTALSLGLRVSGTLGLLLRGKEQHHLPAIKPLIERLLACGFHAHEDLVREVLRLAGESTA